MAARKTAIFVLSHKKFFFHLIYMSCLIHFNQTKLPLLQGLLPPFLLDTPTYSEQNPPPPSEIQVLLDQSFSVEAMDLACYFLNHSKPYQLQVSLNWYLNFIKNAQKPNSMIAPRFQRLMLQNFWQAFEKRPLDFLVLFQDEQNILRKKMIPLIFQPELERFKKIVQNLPPLPLTEAFAGLLQLSNNLN